ncbi:amidase signature domain-containing protein [Hypoxylon cercidicola]|nr:amidase signature domain-containing protein [Hypoxylon cercidicola]
MARLHRILLTASSVWLALAGVVSSLTVKGKTFPSMIDVTIDDLSAGLESGLFTSVDLVNTYVSRIMEVNDTLHAVIEINPDALAIAADLDAKRAMGKNLGPLHGIPILIKNNIATKDKMDNTAGSWSLLGARVPEDSGMAKKLRQAGAIILGKSNLSQWANYRSSNSSNGWSAHGGQVYGAYCPSMDPSGSSSGSGVSSALGLALAALGTETSGSIVSPSQKGNLVGIKPTVGLTSRHLVIPISEHQDTVGPMARTVKDAAYILQAIAGYDPKDNYTSAIPHCGKIPNYLAALDKDGLKGARIGVPYNILPTSNSTEMVAYYDAIEVMKAAGATIVAANFLNGSASTSSVVLEADFVSNLASYLAELTYNPNNIKSLADLREFTQSFALEEYPDRDTETWDEALALGYNNSDGRFWDGLQQNYYAGGEAGLLGAIERNKVDTIIMPTSLSAGRAAIVGAPIVTVPLGFYPNGTTVVTTSRGLVTTAPNVPFGLSFLGGKFTEATLIKLAYAFEQKTMVRNKVQPFLVPTTELGNIVGF